MDTILLKCQSFGLILQLGEARAAQDRRKLPVVPPLARICIGRREL